VLLSLAGGALGLLLANYGVRALVALSAGYLPRAVDVKVDGFVLAFALLVSLLSGIGFGLAPALRGSHADPGDALRGGPRGATGGARGNRLRTSLVVAQVALAVVLVTGSGLMLRSFSHLLAVDLGFEPESALLVRFVVPSNTDIKTPEIHAYRQRMLERVRQIPGILAAGTTTFTPLAGRTGEPREFTVPGMPTPRSGEEPRADTYPVTPGYFRAMGIPLLAGRDLVSGDTVGDDALVAVINRTMAERFFPKGRAVDGRIEIGPKAELRVVGVVADVRAERVDSAPSYTMYVPTNLMTRVNVSMVARTSRDPASMIPAVRAAMREIDPSLPFTQITPMRSVVSDAVATPRFFTVLVVIFGLSALALAMVGLYGVVAYVVAQRRREIAIRMALGAPAAGVVRLMLGRGLLPVGVGLAIGLVVAIASSHLLASLLYEVSPTDPITLAAVSLLLGSIGALAAYLPARRASRVRPAETLRGEG
jgi:predicted permease